MRGLRVAGVVLLLLLLVGAGLWMVVGDADPPAPAPRDRAPAAPARLAGDDSGGAPDAEPPRLVDRSSTAAEPRGRPRAGSEPGDDAEPEPEGDVHLLRGVVRFAGGGPVKGARVRVWDVDATYRGAATPVGEEAVTTSDGRFTVEGLPVASKVVVYAALPGYQTAGVVQSFPSFPASMQIVLGEGGVLTGGVYGPMGKPAADVEVRLAPVRRWEHHRRSRDWRFWAEAGVWEFYVPVTRTDADGHYRFEGVPLPTKTPEARVALVRDPEGNEWSSDEVSFAAAGERAVRDVYAGTTAYAGGTIDPPGLVRAVTVRVTDANGVNVANAQVRIAAFGTETIRWYSGKSAGGGSYTASFPDDAFFTNDEERVVSVTAPGFETWRGPAASASVDVVLRRRERDAAFGRVTGRLVDKDGLPMPGPTEVFLVPFETFIGSKTGVLADANGAFEIDGVLAGDYLMSLDRWKEWVEVTVPWGSAATVTLRSPMARADDPEAESSKDGSARRVTVEGLPRAAGARLLATAGDVNWTAAVSGDRAAFPGLPPGEYKLTLDRPGHDDAERKLVVEEGEGAQTLRW